MAEGQKTSIGMVGKGGKATVGHCIWLSDNSNIQKKKGRAVELEEGNLEGQSHAGPKMHSGMQTVRVYRPNTDKPNKLSEVWVIVTLLEGVSNKKLLLGGKSRLLMAKGGRVIVLTPFPWELNVTQHFKLLRVPDYYMVENVEK